MTTELARQSRERVAWTVLFVGFATFILLGITIPLGINAFLQNATSVLDIAVQANQGTVGIDSDGGQRRAALAGEPPQEVTPRATLLTDTTASALMTMAAPDGPIALTTIQISSNTTLTIDRAISPQFAVSDQPNRINLDLQSGRARIDLPFGMERQTIIRLSTPQGSVTMSESGRYVVDAGTESTQVTVQGTGRAVLMSGDQTLELPAGRRGEMSAGSAPVGPLDPARDLVRNGDFDEGLDEWSVFSWQVEREDQPKGRTEVAHFSTDPAVRFVRDGIGHADVRISQSIGQDVSGYDSVRVLMTLRVNRQSLDVCGIQGSECPIFVILNYVDESGVGRVWQHGFYSQGIVNDTTTPGACISCAVVQRPHERIAPGQRYFYETDLNQELASQGFLPPRLIESLTIVSSGHSFDAEVLDVSIIVE